MINVARPIRAKQEHGGPPCWRPSASMKNRIAMYNGNALKIGLFGANCSSGRSATKVPERWSASWPDCLAPGTACRRGRARFHAADRALERLWRRHRFPRPLARDHHLGGRAARRDQAHDGIRHRACAAVSSADRGQGIRHRRPHRRGPRRRQHRRAAGTKANSTCSASICASTMRATTTRRNGSISSSRPGSCDGTFDYRRQIPAAQERARLSEAVRRYRGRMMMNAGSSDAGQAFACATATRSSSPPPARARRLRGNRRKVAEIKAAAQRARPRDRGVHRRPGDLPPDAEGSRGLLSARQYRQCRLGRDRRHAGQQEHDAADHAGGGIRRQTPLFRRAMRSAAIRSSARPTASPRSSPRSARPACAASAFRSSIICKKCRISATRCCRGWSAPGCGRKH